jgi:NAD(P)-dependent dehydrogenase (short-subunit alcohol dehydrogenase family)
MFDLSGRVALVTGGAGGQGAADAKALLAHGARVVLSDINEDGVQAMARRLDPTGAKVRGVAHDIRQEESWAKVVEKTLAAFGSLSTLVNNAAIHGRGSLDKLTLKDWDEIMATNATSIFVGVKACLPPLRAHGNASIINISSARAGLGSAFDPAYGASKGALRAASRSMALYLARDGIRLNTIYPGTIKTPMSEALLGTRKPEDMAANIPIGRLGTPDDIAGVVVFLASDASRYMVGADIVVDGGELLDSVGGRQFELHGSLRGATTVR